MRIRFILGIIIAGCLVSCGRNAQKNKDAKAVGNSTSKKDTLLYTYKTIEERAPDCGNKPDTACSNAKIIYPVFTDQSTLNDTVNGRLLTINKITEKPDKDLSTQAKNFIQAYMNDSLRKDNPDMVYTLESSATVVRQDPGLTTVQLDRYLFAGGAHGSTYTGFINWSTKENKNIKLDDILVDDYRDTLAAIADKAFHLQDTTILDNNFSMVKNGKLVLTPNFLVTPIGLSFLYNEYEVKPYSEGQTTLLIPYVQIKSLLRPNTVISQYIKK
ncbi:MAG: DUF3298 domain-containing protein [Sphingobacteriales bacterium]